MSTAGILVALPMPSAVKAADRSSKMTCFWKLALEAAASARGVDREPGEITICWTPCRRSVRKNTEVHLYEILPECESVILKGRKHRL